LQLKEFCNLGLSINDSVYSSGFFFLTGLHFFHVMVGLILISLILWSSCFSYFILTRTRG
jgi:heme/copper-type cytochrome/quinol oxidase subunit 3